MGQEQSYEPIQENKEIMLPPVQQEHRYGRAYAKLLKTRLQYQNEWATYMIYDLRTMKRRWALCSKVIGNELKFYFQTLKNGEIHNQWSKLSHDKSFKIYNTVLTTRYADYDITLELYADNIHCQLLQNTKLTNIYIYGYLKVDYQDKIPICF
jgi:hypothetical protein